MTDPRLTIAGQTLHLLPEGGIHWEEEETLLIADPHFGKGAAFRFAGLPVPSGTTGGNLARLDAAMARVQASRIVFLGDFLHAREGRARGTLAALHRWREAHPHLHLTLVRGNHDRHAGDPPDELGIVCVDEPWIVGPFALAHLPRPCPGHYLFGGHIHPAVRLIGRGRQRKRLPCFWFGPDRAVLPAFGDFTGVGIVEPEPGDRVFVIAGDEVLETS